VTRGQPPQALASTINLTPVGPSLPTTQNQLWLGLQGSVHNPHCNLPLLTGFLPFCPLRGICEVQGVGPNLWFAVVGALGFQVLTFCSGDPSFSSLLGSLCLAALQLATSPRRCNQLPDVIFTNLASLPWDVREYWAFWTTPHIFFIPAGDSEVDDWGFCTPSWPPPVPPSGWMVRGQTLSHCKAGGTTLGWWEVVV
jgi:hypothetical protein